MTTDNDLFEKNQHEPEQPDSISPGHLIKQAREAKGLTQQQVADSLRLRLVVVQFIEADEFDKLASATFVRGYLRSLAKALELDENEVFAAYRAHGHEHVAPNTVQMQSFSRRKVKERNDNRLMMMSYGIIIVVIAMVLIWWWQESNFSFSTITGSDDAPTEQEAQQLREDSGGIPQVVRQRNGSSQQRLTEEEVAAGDTSTVSVESAQTPNAPPTLTQQETDDTSPAGLSLNDNESLAELADDTTDTTDTTESASDTPATKLNEQPSIASAAEPQAQPDAAEPAPAAEQLVFTFNEACWVKVTDATGEDIAIGVKAAGYRMPLTGEPPFAIILCRPEAVNITYRGDAVNLDNYVRDRSVTLTLD
ncbi:DUF4115 domain-containing protein [Pseudidiomarina sp. 1APP75-32.1]|uniref:DUF4115 domain-containing protein n=1 Tax=Pseudidiomarina terrestris TaxID=2820060 RepID=A0AAW7R1D1_9GAMM|nr:MULTISPECIES: RodZ domain-containing protein [unclassified Pseudidiomarina]MDN7124435.1 DUF4115 domain-containing protein [Pseudidiomarina sp. 1APP75-32.1]MDN7129274.1 DUF4115 domain-containing protein [Pseudidiomarina sp. 1APR75-15]